MDAETLYLNHRNGIYVYLRQHGCSSEDAEDLTSETYVRALRALDRYDEDRGRPGGWLLRIAHNLLVDAHRRPAARARTCPVEDAFGLADPDPEAAPESAAVRHLERRDLLMALEQLPPHLSATVRARHLCHLSLSETAARMDCSVGTVKSRQSRGLAALRRTLEVV